MQCCSSPDEVSGQSIYGLFVVNLFRLRPKRKAELIDNAESIDIICAVSIGQYGAESPYEQNRLQFLVYYP